jgi:TonB family protein
LRLKAEETSVQTSVKQCPRCMRVFNAYHTYCLFDTTPLIDAAQAKVIASSKSPLIDAAQAKVIASSKSSSMTRLVFLVILTFVGTGVLGFFAINYPQGWPGLARPGEPKEQLSNEPPDESVIVGGMLNGKEASLPKPEYPSRARKLGALGKVTVAVHVDQNGTVTKAYALDGHPLLQTAAVVAAKKTKFSAEKLNNQRLTSGTITYTFK